MITLEKALKEEGWKFFQLNGISYRTETVLGNKNNASWLEKEAEIVIFPAKYDFEEAQVVIYTDRKRNVFDQIESMMIDEAIINGLIYDNA